MEKFILESNAFKNNGNIPKKYTCDGDNISPQLSWKGVPLGTKSLILIMDDPDAQKVIGRTFVHWIVNGIPPEINQLPEDVLIEEIPEAQEIENDSGNRQYYGPCPPDKEHSYFFTLFALSEYSGLNVKINANSLRALLKDYIKGEAQLVGKYKRNRK